MVLCDTSLLVVSILVSVSSPSRGDVLNDDEDLDTVLCLPLEKVIQPVPLVSRSAEVELRRYPTRELPSSLHASISLPPVVDVDPVLGHVDSSTQVPEVITLPSAKPLPHERKLTPSTSHWAATLTRSGANESNRFRPVHTDCAAIRSMLTMNWCICR